MFRSICFATLATAMLALAPLSAAQADTCQNRNEAGVCLDAALPTVGVHQQIKTINDQDALDSGKTANGTTIWNAGNKDGAPRNVFGVVTLNEPAYVYAHNLCYYVDGKVLMGAEAGKALNIGLKRKDEFESIKNAAGVTVVPCCLPVQTTVCGATKTVNNPQKVGFSKTFTGGDSKRVTLTCSGGTGGSVPTLNSSWAKAQSGQCDAPASGGGGYCGISNDKDWCNSQNDNGGGNDEGRDRDGYHDKGGEGANGQGNF